MSYSLFELHEFIRRIVALNLGDPVWVKCELSQIQVSRGHAYLGLVQKDENGQVIIAQGDGVIWQKKLNQLRRKIGLEFDSLLRQGMQVLLLVQVDFHERYGLKLVVEDIDPAYSFGQLELQRQESIQMLKSERLLDKNEKLELPLVLQNLAIISSETAAGLQDFQQQLKNNPYGYQFKTRLFSAAMQGENTVKEVIERLEQIEKLKNRFDSIVIVRGGGAKLDLAVFDDVDICRAVANSSLPVISGIGHEIDGTVLDMVAHTSLKTPTAAAEFIIQSNLFFESNLLELSNTAVNLARQKVIEADSVVNQYYHHIQIFANGMLKREHMMLEYIEKQVHQQAGQFLNRQKIKLGNWENIIGLLRPEAAFQRGFSLTSIDGEIVTSAKKLKDGDEIVTHFKNGDIKSVVKK